MTCSSARQARLFLFHSELYTVVQNKSLEKLIADQDRRSIVDLSRLQLIDRDIGVVIRHAIYEKKCRGLNLWGNQLTWESMHILANVSHGNRTLKELDLSHNRLDDRGTEILANVLALNNCGLKEIDLSSNNITDRGAHYLARMLRTNTKLERLILDNNEITDRGLNELIEAMAHHGSRLKTLRVESNRSITQNGIARLITAFRNSPVEKEVYVRNCGANDVNQLLDLIEHEDLPSIIIV